MKTKNPDCDLISIEKVKIGDFFRRIGGKKVYVRDEYNRFCKRYEAHAWEDFCNYAEFKKGTLVEINFTF